MMTPSIPHAAVLTCHPGTYSEAVRGIEARVRWSRGALGYWALKHPPGRPDFHHPDGFALELDPPDGEAVNESVMGKR